VAPGRFLNLLITGLVRSDWSEIPVRGYDLSASIAQVFHRRIVLRCGGKTLFHSES
jgi:hypothetical protein